MKRTLVVIACLLAVSSGCHRRCARVWDARGSRANLVLGNSPETASLAQEFATRTDWPAVDVGFRVENVTFFTTTLYDEQAHYDRYGWLSREAISVESGVQLR